MRTVYSVYVGRAVAINKLMIAMTTMISSNVKPALTQAMLGCLDCMFTELQLMIDQSFDAIASAAFKVSAPYHLD